MDCFIVVVQNNPRASLVFVLFYASRIYTNIAVVSTLRNIIWQKRYERSSLSFSNAGLYNLL